MKKVIISTIIFTTVAVSFAQNSNVTNAIMTYKEGSESYAEAKTYIDKAIVHPKTSPKSKTWFWSGQINQSLGIKNEDAELLIEAGKSYAKSIELNENASFVSKSNNNSALLFNDISNIAINKHKQDDVAGALKLYDVALQIKPTDTLVIGNASMAASELKQYDKVISINKMWASQNNVSSTPYLNIIKANIDKNDNNGALNASENALAKFPTNQKILTEKSNALMSLGRSDEAISSLEKMLEVNPKNAMAMTILGSIYDKKDKKKASEYYVKALAIDSSIEDANFNLGSNYFNEGAEKFNTVNEMSLKVYQATGKKVEAEGKALMEKSIPYFEKVKELMGKRVDQATLQSLLTAYQKTGKTAEADEISKVLYGE